MVELKLFGSPILERNGATITGGAIQRHRMALLALLALAPDHRLSRDKLIAYLWPESDLERGRNLLKVATYVLRSALGDHALLSAGDDLRLNPDQVRVDVVEFEAAYAEQEYGRAAGLYRAPFLDGFFLSAAPEFEEWAERERGRLAAAHCTVFEALAEAAERTSDYPRALRWWNALAAEDPFDSRVALRLMLALEASGNRAGALQYAAVHQRRLKEGLGTTAPQVVALAKRLRTEAAMPGDEATRGRSEPSAPGLDNPAIARLPEPQESHTRSRRRSWRGAAAMGAAILTASVAFALRPRGTDAVRSIVVLPFVNLSPRQENEYLGAGLTEEIITRLSAVPGLKVISRTSAMHYQGSGKTLPEIARELQVDHVLEGSVRETNGRVRISAQLIDARADEHLWADSYEYGLGDSFGVQEQIAREVARALQLRLGARTRRLLSRRGTGDAEAYDLYRRGRYLWYTRSREGHVRAIEYYQRALARDSLYADAYSGLADAYLTAYQGDLFAATAEETYSRIKWAAERALALDPESADAHTSFAIALWWQRNWPGAERELRRAIELNPGYAMARSWYGQLLSGMGRLDEARKESHRALELDPFAVVINSNYGQICYLVRDYDCATNHFRRTLEPDSTWATGHWRLGVAYARKNQLAEATRSISRAVELGPERPEFLADLAGIQALAGETVAARATLARAKQRPREGFSIARAHVALGEPDSAFAWLERASWQWPHRAARADPALDPLRSDPRFARLAVRVDREMGMR